MSSFNENYEYVFDKLKNDKELTTLMDLKGLSTSILKFFMIRFPEKMSSILKCGDSHLKVYLRCDGCNYKIEVSKIISTRDDYLMCKECYQYLY